MRSNVKRIDTRRAHWKSRKDSPRSESSSGALIGRKKSTLSNILSCRALNSFGVLIALVLFLAVMVTLLVTEPTAHASNPSSGTLTLTSSSLTWKGTAIGGGAQNDLGLGVFGAEDLCQEGITCDTYTLTISGAPADWANAKKLVHVHLGWTIPTQDFDLYIHKGDLSGPVVVIRVAALPTACLPARTLISIRAAPLSAPALSPYTSSIGPARKTTYYYRVRAVRATAKSGYSNIAAARTK